MLSRIIDFVIRQRYVVLVATLLLIVAGLVALLHLPLDAFPDTTPVLVQVNVSAPGWAPEEMERQITFPIEQALAGLAGLVEVRSISKYGLAQGTLIFADGTDIYLARQQLTERLVEAELPDGRPRPEVR